MKILFVEPNETTLFCFRKDLLDTLIAEGYDVDLCIESTERVQKEYKSKLKSIFDVKCNLKNKSILSNLRLRHVYKKVIKQSTPDIILSFTIKPNIYCAAHASSIPIITNITGLGTAFNKKTFLNKLVVQLYKKAFKNVDLIMFQNEHIKNVFINNKIPINDSCIIPGSGVKVDRFSYMPLRSNEQTRFLYVSRLIKEKGFYLLLSSIPKVLSRYPKSIFTIIGKIEKKEDEKRLQDLFKCFPNNIRYLRRTENLLDHYYDSDYVVAPSYYNEGVSNVLLESLSCGRPIITTDDNPGCMELLDCGRNGIGVKSASEESLVNGLLTACSSTFSEKEQQGINGRSFVVKNYNKETVINIYLKAIKKLLSKLTSEETIR